MYAPAAAFTGMPTQETPVDQHRVWRAAFAAGAPIAATPRQVEDLHQMLEYRLYRRRVGQGSPENTRFVRPRAKLTIP